MKKLQVYENISLRWELWRGLGAKELIISLIVTATNAAAAILFCLFSSWEMDTLVAMIYVICIFGICTGAFTKMDNNQSIYDYYKHRLAFFREQQSFWYKKENEVIRIAEE